MRHALIMLLLAIAMTAAPAIGFSQTASRAEAEIAQEIAQCMVQGPPVDWARLYMIIELPEAGAPSGGPGAVHTGIGHSERNRPTEPPAATESSEFVEQALRDLTERGAPPADVAAMVLDAVRAGRYLQLTHDGYVGALRIRTEELLGGGLPQLPYFD